MNAKWFSLIVVTVLLASPSLVSAEDSAAAVQASVPNRESESKYLLGIDLRPSWYGGPNKGNVGSENTINAGIQFTKDTAFNYEQYIDTIVPADQTIGINPKMREGAARILVNNIWTNSRLGLALSYENRTLLPWDSDLRDKGRVLANRNYIKLKKDITPTFSITVAETPIFFIHTRPNTIIGGSSVNNEAFQNRVYLIGDARFLDGKLKLYVPIWLQSTTKREEDLFKHKLLAWPELDYSVTNNITVGLAYVTDNMVKPDLDGFAIDTGIRDGYTQLVFAASL